MTCDYDGPRHAPARTAPRRIGLLTYGAGDPNSQAVWQGVLAAARQAGAGVVCFAGKPLRSPHGFEAQANIVYDLAGPENVDGLVIWAGALCHQVDVPALADFCRRYRPLPMVTLGNPLVDGIPGVVIDNYQGMYEVVTHLVEFHNLPTIAFVRGPEPQPEAEQRYRAYLDVLAEHGIPFRPELVVQGSFRESGGAAAVQVLLDERQVAFQALVAASDNMAVGALRGLQRRGIRVPGDIAVAGFNDEAQSEVLTPPLTTAPFRSYQMARRASEMLLALLAGEAVPERVSLATRLVVRQSCGCPDPLVAEAAVLAARPPDRPLAAALGQRRESVLAGMAAGWELALENVPTVQLTAMLDAFAAEMAGQGDGAFQAAMTEILQAALEGGATTVSHWQSAVSALRRETLPLLRDRSASLRAEGLLGQARILIGETGQRLQAYQAFQAQEESRILAAIAQSFGNAVSLSDLKAALAQALPRLAIPRAYLALYTDPAARPLTARLAIAGEEDGREAPGDPAGAQDALAFPAARLIPAGLPPAWHGSLVVEPLFYRDEQLGFVVFEAEPRLQEACEILRDQIAGALKRGALYRQAEQARQAAEEGRRLAEEANLLKSRFLSTVSHELRTPLSLIVGTIEMLLRARSDGQAALPAAYRRDLRSIGSGAQHLARLIGDVLDLASSQAGELRLAAEPLRLAGALAQAVTLAEAMAREKGLAWESHIPEDLPAVWGDRTRLQQVVLNLVGNAVKFTEQGYVRLWAAAGNQQVVVAVTDSGMGIPADEQEFIFDEFRQSERTARRGYGGMGLGLAISRRLVELHGGQIGVVSSGGDGAGSTFYFTLPALAASPEPAGRVAALPGRVLLLAERAASGARLARHLAGRGFSVEAVVLAAGADWLAPIMAQPPAAIVLDFAPAAERGWELLQLLRRNPATQDIPVVFYSLAAAGDRGAALALDVLAKPLAPAALAQALVRQGFLADGCPDGQTILVVDDAPRILDLHVRLLGELAPACRILSAGDGQEALARMREEPVDLVLLDLMMPVLDGFAVLEAMAADERLRAIPVIVLTAQILTAQDMARLQERVAAVLSKGLFTGAEVLAMVTGALERSKRLGSEAQRVVRQAMAYIHEHYAEPFSREHLARAIGLSDRYLTQCFHAETGITPVDYLNRYRIRQACTLLEGSELGITGVALQVGFSDSSYFGRVFRAELGVTPSAYRRGERAAADRQALAGRVT